MSNSITNIDPISLRRASLHVKKPLNAFFRYKQYMRDKLVEISGTNENCTLARLAAQMWKQESKSVKDHFSNLTLQEYKEHRLKYPGYIWPSRSSKFKKSILKSNFISNIDTIGLPIDDFKTGWTPELDKCLPVLEYINVNKI